VYLEHPLHDLRAPQVALTGAGRQLVQRVLEVHADQVDRVMGGLDGNEHGELNKLLTKLGQHLKELVDARS
jgi:DNA-binding MarR family transcriptional regulator